MDLTNINSVSQLISANEDRTPFEIIGEQVRDLDANQRIAIASAILSSVKDFCAEMAIGNITNEFNNSSADKAAQWADDAASVRSALLILQEINV
jgi:lipid II:glycine glycyltransferase (peptidoglycan interpeptide bridge formation enzyme)